ncbi:MAG: ATP-dependent DNA helicase RecG [Candidatus Gottesmanbacteria bacterium GW2011_GWA1_42_26]|nr:MAG: ATP-dependent DNA helicase RecG [Candidatus Gottesmanbacteria bacterium GW2011_GWA1_42_26]
MDWHTPVRFVPGIGPILATKLEKLEIFIAGDLLTHIPFRYEDYSVISKIANLQAGETVTVIGQFTTLKNAYTKRGFNLQKAVITDETGSLDVTWFNQPFLVKTFNSHAGLVALVGKVDMNGFKLVLPSPQYEIVKPNTPLIHSGRIVPIYPETAGITSKWLRTRIFSLLETSITHEYLPTTLINTLGFISFPDALSTIHFPKSLNQVEAARRRLAFDELFIRQFEALMKRREWNKHILTKPLQINEQRLQKLIASLPFTLTPAQEKVIDHIIADLKSNKPMNRLLQGDVGSGKTVVAAIAMYITYLNQGKSLIMAPTEILAEQHYQTLNEFLTPSGIKVGIQTGSKKDIKPSSPPLKLRGGRVGLFDVLVGTHALLEKKVKLDDVKLVVIDEQHRFGAQIKRAAAYGWIRTQVKNTSQQAFIVCPFIEPSESISTVKAATHEFNHLRADVFPDLRLALLHGKLTSRQKQTVLTDFRHGKYDILVCTPVVEVGIDIPQATIMLVEAAERFGLAQLHQLRGRVGRSDTQSYCLLFTSENTSQALGRLKHLETAATGAELAELDFKIRGPGQIYGLAQHGRDQLKIATFGDLQLIELARIEAQKLFAADSTLSQLPLLKERVRSGKIGEIVPD